MADGPLTFGLVQHYARQLLQQTDAATVDAVSKEVQLPNPLSVSADTKISVIDEARFAEAASRASRDMDFAFLVGLKLSFATALPGYISEHSRTLRDAMLDAARFMPVVRPGLEFALRESGNVASIRCRLSDPKLEQYPRHLEGMFAGVVGQIRAFTARPFIPDALSFQHDRVEIGREVRRKLGCGVTFGRVNTEMLVPLAVLDRPIRGRDDALRALLIDHGEILAMQNSQTEISFPEKVELAVLQAVPEGAVEAEDIARKLGVSRRTLARRLKGNGTTLTDVVDRVRITIAARELRETSRQIGEIAWRLGYESPSSFTRAFRRTMGHSPRAFRALNADGPSDPI